MNKTGRMKRLRKGVGGRNKNGKIGSWCTGKEGIEKKKKEPVLESDSDSKRRKAQVRSKVPPSTRRDYVSQKEDKKGERRSGLERSKVLVPQCKEKGKLTQKQK